MGAKPPRIFIAGLCLALSGCSPDSPPALTTTGGGPNAWTGKIVSSCGSWGTWNDPETTRFHSLRGQV
jgi:hypothetical protein